MAIDASLDHRYGIRLAFCLGYAILVARANSFCKIVVLAANQFLTRIAKFPIFVSSSA